ncbi:MAG: amylo-alpha-1,6-glucosidase [Candidatus Altiarchaeota archaeon]|nr:amylo-alpha-1,6-glucosidase [Candidatus Altiarchaeota archaeon]
MRYSDSKMSETPFATFNPNALGQERSRGLEWLIPNRLGGYCASTILDLPTNRHQALLVSACDNLKRRVYLEGLEEGIHLEDRVINLKDPCYKGPGKFDFNHNSVSYYHHFDEFSLTKTINPMQDKNGVVVLYNAENKNPVPLKIRVKVLANSREANAIGSKGIEFQSKFFTDKILGVSSELGYLTIYSDKAICRENEGERWDSFIYSDNKENFHHIPAFFEFFVNGNSTHDFTLSALAYETEEKTASAFKDLSQLREKKSRILSSDMGSSIFALLKIAETFIVDIDSKKSIISYPFSGENVREAMIALPGLTLINQRFDDAEPVFERILNSSTRNGVPGSIIDGEPVYDSIDTTLWLIDRLYKYGKAAGMERLKGLLHTYWWDMKDMVKGYIDMEKNGLLMHKGGTWMPNRDNAVEVQGLWYNSLKIMENLSGLMEDKEIDFRGIYHKP